MNISEAIRQTPFLLGQLIDWPARVYPERTAIEWDAGQLTFEQLRQRVSERAENFKRSGARPLQRWALALGNSPDFLISLFALWRLGCVVAPLRQMQTAEHFNEAARSADLHALVLTKDCPVYEELASAASRSERIDEVVVLFLKEEGVDESLEMNGRATIDVDPALILWSSGSTGRSRGIVLQHHAVLANIWSNIRTLGFRDDDRTLIVLPLAHAYALIHQCLCHLAIGATVCLPPAPLAPNLLCRALEQFNITTLATAPPVLHILVEGLRRSAARYPALRLLTIGAARANPQTVREFRSLLPQAQLAVTYGLTEAGPRVCTHFVEADEFDPHCVGRPNSNMEVRLRSTAGGEQEILVRGRSFMRSYADESYEEGMDYLLSTGDTGEMLDGRLNLRGRLGRVINRGGALIRPETIEDALLAHPAVRSAHVESAPHPFWGEVPVATVVLNPQASEVMVEDLNYFCAERLLGEERPAQITVGNGSLQLPKTRHMLSMFKEGTEE